MGLRGEARMAALSGLFGEVCSLLGDSDGLRAVPTPRKGLPPNAMEFSVSAEISSEKIGMPEVRRITVFHASDGKATTVFSLTDLHDGNPIHPLIVLDFWVERLWNPQSQNLPFFRRLAETLRTDKLILGYSMYF